MDDNKLENESEGSYSTIQNTNPVVAAPKKSKRRPIIIGSVVAGVFLLGAGIFYNHNTNNQDSNSTTSTTASQNTTPNTLTTTSGTITATTASADAFLATLSDSQRETVVYDYDDETKTTSWSNFPVTFVERAGLNLTDLTEEQRTAALAVLKSLLNDDVYTTVADIMGGDQF